MKIVGCDLHAKQQSIAMVDIICDLDAQIEHRFDLQRLAIDPVPECVAFKEFHRDEGSSIDLVDFVDRADVWVVQGGRSLGFPLEKGPASGPRCYC
jgi:hypothetical protein